MSWLATRACHEWVGEGDRFEERLEGFEAKIVRALAEERGQDTEVEALRQRLSLATARGDDLETQVTELRHAQSTVKGAGGGATGVPSSRPARPGARAGLAGSSAGAVAPSSSAPQQPLPSSPVGVLVGVEQQPAAPVADVGPAAAVSTGLAVAAERVSGRDDGTQAGAGPLTADISPEAADLAPALSVAASCAAARGGAPPPLAASIGPAAPAAPAPAGAPAVAPQTGHGAASGVVEGTAEMMRPVVGPVVLAEREVRRRRLLSCAFVTAIDLSLVPTASDLRTPPRAALEAMRAEEAALGGPEKGPLADATCPWPWPLTGGSKQAVVGAAPMGTAQLRVLIREVYAFKREDDRARDSAGQERRALQPALQEFLKRRHGVKTVVHQKSWQLVEALLAALEGQGALKAGGAPEGLQDPLIRDPLKGSAAGGGAVAPQRLTPERLFGEFLDGTRSTSELSFHLYAADLRTGVGAATPPPPGYCGVAHAQAVAELLFGDLPKVALVLRAELERRTLLANSAVSSGGPDAPGLRSFEGLAGGSECLAGGGSSEGPPLAGPARTRAQAAAEPVVPLDGLHEALLEGWRMAGLLFDYESGPEGLPWAACSTAFVRADARTGRGFLHPEEAREALDHVLGSAVVRALSVWGLVQLPERTTLGALARVLRAGWPEAASRGLVRPLLDEGPEEAPPLPGGREAAARSLQVCEVFFQCLERPIAGYLTGLMHSDEPKDQALYASLKVWLFSFRRALRSGQATEGLRCLRGLLLLVLSAQADFQAHHGLCTPEHADRELRGLFRLLQYNWRLGDGVDPVEEESEERAAEEGYYGGDP